MRVLLAVAVVLVFLQVAQALSSPCGYCTYCDFCDECSKCPCSPTTNKNCNYCKYCKYCSLCSMCSVCNEGGFLDKVGTYMTQIKEQFGYGLDELKDDEVTKDLESFDVNKARRGLKKKAKDEL